MENIELEDKGFELIPNCTCGASLISGVNLERVHHTSDDNIYKCTFCGVYYKRRDIKTYAEKIKLSLNDEVTAALVEQRNNNIITLRTNLAKEITKKSTKRVRKPRIIELCNELLNMLGEDTQAECFRVLSETEPDPDDVIGQLNKINVTNGYELALVGDILNYIFDHVYVNKKYLAAISDLIHRAYEGHDDEQYRKFSKKFEEAVKKEEYDVYDTTKKRVAFIAHATEDRELAFKLVDKIEGRLRPDACFISERNLKHASASEYDTKMPEAIENCAIFVLVSSKYSRDRACGTIREMNVVISNDESTWRAKPEYESKYDGYAKIPEKYKKHRLEWRLDPKGGDRTEDGNYVKFFFGTQDWLTNIDEVADKIIEMWNDIVTAQPQIETQAAKKKICLGCGTETNLEDQYCPKCGGASFVTTYKEYLKIKEERAEAVVREAKEESEKLKRENTKLNKQIEKSKVQRTKPVRQKVMSEGARMGFTIMKWVIGGLLFAIGVVLAVFGFISATVLYSDELRFALFILICVGFVLHMAFMSLTFVAKSNSIFNEASAGRKFLSVLLYIFSIVVGYVGCAVCVYTGIFGLIFAFLGGVLLVLFLPVYDLSPSGAAAKTLNIVLVCLIILGWFLGVSSIMWRSYYTDVSNGEYFDFEYQISQTDPDEVVITGYNGDSTEIVVPTEIEGKAVCMVGPHAFENCVNVESITIEADISEIGAYSFSGCTSLTSIVIPNSVTSVGMYAFSGCTALIEITIPDSVTSIGEGAFNSCASLYTVTIPDSITSVSMNAFMGCNNLTEVTMPSQYLSAVPKDNLKTVVITSGTTIEEYEFAGCSSLESITIADGVESIGSYAFSGCASLVEIDIPSRVTAISEGLFYECTSLESITIADGVGSIGDYAFSGCTSLSQITIPNSVNSIGDEVFADCQSLTEVIIHASCSSRGYNVFSGCTSLTALTISGASFYFNSQILPFGAWFGEHSYAGSAPVEQNIYDSDTGDLVETTIYYIPSSLKNVTVAGGSIDNGAFLNCANISEINITSDLDAIGDNAFQNCTSLTKIIIPEGVTRVGDAAFDGCNNIVEITCPAGCLNAVPKDSLQTVIITGGTAIEDYALQNSYSLLSVTIPDSVTLIGANAFSGCIALTEIIIPSGVESIGSGAFYGCNLLAKIYIPDSVTQIGAGAFSGCTALTEIIVPSGVESIGSGAFSGCSALQSITLPFVGGSATANSSSISTHFGYIFGSDSYSGGVPTLQNYNSSTAAIYYIPSSLTSVVINGGNILYGSFYNCSRIRSIVLGDIQSIGSYAFHNCSSLSNLTIPNSMISIGSYAFDNCSSLINIAIPSSVEDIDNSAFNNCSSLSGVYITDVAAWCAIDFENYLANPLCYAGNLYLNDELMSDLVIPNSVTYIRSYAFFGCTSLTSIVIPNSVTSVGSYAFSGCTSLTSAVFEQISGWRAQYTNISSNDLSDPAMAATYLTDEYRFYYWYHS